MNGDGALLIAIVASAAMIAYVIEKGFHHLGERVNNHARIMDEIRQQLSSIKASIDSKP
jgi:hypothetical protein